MSDVILKRNANGQVSVNVTHQRVLHSPTGFEWGYGGSGPADLALNILLQFTDPMTAELLHQAFKWEFIATMPHEGGTISGVDIRSWITKAKNEAGL